MTCICAAVHMSTRADSTGSPVIALALGAGTALVGLVVPSVRVLYDYSWFVGLGCRSLPITH